MLGEYAKTNERSARWLADLSVEYSNWFAWHIVHLALGSGRDVKLEHCTIHHTRQKGMTLLELAIDPRAAQSSFISAPDFLRSSSEEEQNCISGPRMTSCWINSRQVLDHASLAVKHRTDAGSGFGSWAMGISFGNRTGDLSERHDLCWWAYIVSIIFIWSTLCDVHDDDLWHMSA